MSQDKELEVPTLIDSLEFIQQAAAKSVEALLKTQAPPAPFFLVQVPLSGTATVLRVATIEEAAEAASKWTSQECQVFCFRGERIPSSEHPPGFILGDRLVPIPMPSVSRDESIADGVLWRVPKPSEPDA